MVRPDDALALQNEFRAQPFGVHSRALASLLSHMRAMPIEGKLCLVCTKPYETYAIARMTARRGIAPELVDNRVFTTLEEAEWEIFKLRWRALFGEPVTEDVF